MRATIALVLGLGLVSCAAPQEGRVVEGESRTENGVHSFVPADGFVPTEAAAIGVGEVILSAIYGAETIRDQRPLRAALQGDVWIVQGTLPEDHVGGVALVEISKSDGTVLRVTHGL